MGMSRSRDLPCITMPRDISVRIRSFGGNAGAGGKLLRADERESESGDCEYMDVVFGRRQFLPRARGGFESSLQQRIFVARRLHVFKSTG